MGILSRGEDWLDDKLLDKESVIVTLRRGELVTPNVKAVLGFADAASETDRGETISHELRTYFIAAADYRFGGEITEPQTGDVIEETANGALRQQVQPLADEPAARYTGPRRRQWRINTKRVGEPE